MVAHSFQSLDMRVCYGWNKTPLRLSLEARYFPEHLMGMIAPYVRAHTPPNPLLRVPVWINLDDQYIRLESQEEILLACRLACIYHNGPDCRAVPDDEWVRETAEMEARAAKFYADAEEPPVEAHAGGYARVQIS